MHIDCAKKRLVIYNPSHLIKKYSVKKVKAEVKRRSAIETWTIHRNISIAAAQHCTDRNFFTENCFNIVCHCDLEQIGKQHLKKHPHTYALT